MIKKLKGALQLDETLWSHIFDLSHDKEQSKLSK